MVASLPLTTKLSITCDRWLSIYALSLHINSFYHSQLNTTPSFSLHSVQYYNSVDLKQSRRIPEHKGGSLLPPGCSLCFWHFMTVAIHIFPVGKTLSCFELGLNSCCRAHTLPLKAYCVFLNYQYYWMTMDDKKNCTWKYSADFSAWAG
jgi:hypothetical protein